MTAFADFDPVIKAIALLLGGTVALGSHGTKAATRVVINGSPEPLTNILASTGEDVAVFGLMGLTLLHPIVGGICALIAIAATIHFLPKIIRLLIRGFAAAKRRLAGSAARSGILAVDDLDQSTEIDLSKNFGE